MDLAGKRLIFCLFFAATTLVTPAMAAAQQQPVTREDIENRRQEIVVTAMKLTDDKQKAAFLEIYVPYQEKLMAILKGRKKLIEQFVDEEKNGVISDAEASKILRSSLGLDGQQLHAESTYVDQLKKIMPVEQALRAYQIETRLNALYVAAIAEVVPLVK
ncbi:MAG: hypothetical protein ACLQDV_28555 [Candidatus Binataceae bacterium]